MWKPQPQQGYLKSSDLGEGQMASSHQTMLCLELVLVRKGGWEEA